MTTLQLVLSYVAIGLGVGALGAAVACDEDRSMQVRTCATWVALTCLGWPLTALALVGIAVTEHRRREQYDAEPVRGVMHSASSYHPY